jgi:hypothetical protein
MSRWFIMLAQVDTDDFLPVQSKFANSRFWEFVLLLGSLALVAIIVAFWAIFNSNRGKPHKHRRKHSHRRDSRKNPGGGVRRPQRPMNPTLAQTRGLPPVRDPNTPPPFP